MRVLQFVCDQYPQADTLKEYLVDQLNVWSRLKWLADDPSYVTAKYNVSLWKPHTTVANLWWFDYDSVYNHLGDDGRILADSMFGDNPLQGLLKRAPLIDTLPDLTFNIVEIEDLVEAGYLIAPEQVIYQTPEPILIPAVIVEPQPIIAEQVTEPEQVAPESVTITEPETTEAPVEEPTPDIVEEPVEDVEFN
jgi:hypothetical protein